LFCQLLGELAHEATIFYKCLASFLSTKWGIVVPSLWAGFALFLAEAVIRTLLQDSTSNGPCKGGVSVNELMYNVHSFFIIRAGIANDDHFVKKSVTLSKVITTINCFFAPLKVLYY